MFADHGDGEHTRREVEVVSSARVGALVDGVGKVTERCHHNNQSQQLE